MGRWLGALAAVCAIAAAAACGRDEPSDEPKEGADAVAPDRGKPADGLYDRELAFLASEGRRALLFSSRADIREGGGVVRALAWADVDGAWQELLDESREFAELRDPWRIFPLGRARLIVGDEGSLDRLSLPGSRGALHLRPLSPPTDMPAAGARLSVREAALITPDDSIAGVLVDAMVAFGASDSASANAAIHAALTAPDGPVVVLAGGEHRGPLLVADVGGEELLETEVLIQPGTRAGEWRVVSADTSVVGTLRATDEDASETASHPIAVAGRIALAGTLYPLAGVLRVPSASR